MYRAAGGERGKLGKRQRLVDEPLPGERSVAVHQHRHDAAPLAVPEIPLLGAHDALDHRIDRFEMARIGAERKVDAAPVLGAVIARIPEMVLDVTVSLDARRQEHALEFREDHLVGLAQHVREHVQSPAVRHAHDDLFDAQRARAFDDRIEQRNQGFRTLEREALLTDVLGPQELLERLGGDQPLEDVQTFLVRQAGPVAAALHVVFEPVALLVVADVDQLDTEGTAVGFAQRLDELTERHVGETAERAGRNRSTEVVRAEAETLELEIGMGSRAVAEWVEVGDEVAEVAIRLDEVGDAQRRGSFGCDRRAVLTCELVAREHERPALVDGFRIVLVLPV